YVNLADWTSIYGEPAKGLSLYREGIAYAMSRGDVRSTVWAKAETSWRLFELGRWDDVIEVADELAGWEEQHGQAQPGVISGIEKMHVLTCRGSYEEAARLEEELLPRAREIRDPQVLWQALAEADGSVEEAVEGYREGAEAWERGGFVFEQANALLAAGRCLLLLGQAAEASVEVSAARELFARLRAEPLLRECDDLLGEA